MWYFYQMYRACISIPAAPQQRLARPALRPLPAQMQALPHGSGKHHDTITAC
jgi:hypothetical protein